jgi:hypothetical protein
MSQFIFLECGVLCSIMPSVFMLNVVAPLNKVKQKTSLLENIQLFCQPVCNIKLLCPLFMIFL